MTNDFINRVRQRTEEMGLSLEAAAKLAKLDRGYFSKVEERGSTPRGDTLTKIAKTLDVSEQWLLTGQDAPRRANGTPGAPELPSREAMPNDVPVRGTAAGSHTRGAFQFEGGIIDYVRRPPALMGARDVYALFVEGTSMEPQFHPGDLIYINPFKPPKAGDAVIIMTKNSGFNPEEATLGIYVKRNEKFIVIRKHNPLAEIQVLHNAETKVHKVLTMNELFGV